MGKKLKRGHGQITGGKDNTMELSKAFKPKVRIAPAAHPKVKKNLS